MNKKNLENWGYTFSCLGGLIVCFNFTIWKDSEWGLWLSLAAVVFALAGVYMIAQAKK